MIHYPTPDQMAGDCPTNPKLGELFDKFCQTETGRLLLDPQAIQEGDKKDWVELILKNRMRRAFEAGYETRQYE